MWSSPTALGSAHYYWIGVAAPFNMFASPMSPCSMEVGRTGGQASQVKKYQVKPEVEIAVGGSAPKVPKSVPNSVFGHL